MSATARSLSRFAPSRPCRLTERNAGPVSMPDVASQRRHARTGQVAGWLPYGRPRIAPSASWSVLDLRKISRKPASSSLTSSTSRATSSLRRSAPAKPNSSRGPVPGVGQAAAERGHHRRNHFRAGRSHLAGCHAFTPADAGPDRSHPSVPGRGLEPRHLVDHADRGQAPPDRRGLAALGDQCGDVEGNCGRCRRQRLDRRDC